MALVAGVDSSTQSCKLVVLDTETGEIVRQAKVEHPAGTEVDPEHWWRALTSAIEQVGGLGDVSAISIAGQQHGMVVLDSAGKVIRPALLWNDTRSAPQAQQLIDHFGADYLTEKTGSIPVASFTSTKLLWLSQNEPENAKKVAAVALPHDWLSWRLSDAYPNLRALGTDYSDASGTGYFNGQTGGWLEEIISYCLPNQVQLPRLIAPGEVLGRLRSDLGPSIPIAAGMGDNAAAAKGLGLNPGDFVISIGTSGTVFGYAAGPSSDPSGAIAGFSNADGGYLPLVCTLNAARVLEWGAGLLDVSLDEFAQLALAAKPGAGGVKVIPYLEGERTPNLPDATASITGLTLTNGTRENLARAAVEGMLSGLAHGLNVIREQGHQVNRLLLIGGGAKSAAVQQIARELFSEEVVVPASGEYVAIGAAKQAAELL
jgi:xylulokinase